MPLVSVLDLDHTAHVTWVDCYSTKVVWAKIQDAKENLAFVCIDLRKDSPTRNRLFERAIHPVRADAVLLELGSEQEGIAVPLISRWLDSDQPTKLGMSEQGRELVKNALLHLGEPVV